MLFLRKYSFTVLVAEWVNRQHGYILKLTSRILNSFSLFCISVLSKLFFLHPIILQKPFSSSKISFGPVNLFLAKNQDWATTTAAVPKLFLAIVGPSKPYVVFITDGKGALAPAIPKALVILLQFKFNNFAAIEAEPKTCQVP